MSRWGWRRAVPALCAVVLVATGTAGSCGDPSRPAATPTGTPPSPAGARSAAPVRALAGVPMPTPTGLRLLAAGWLVDVDAGTRTPAPRATWLAVPGGGPRVFVEGRAGTGELGPVVISGVRPVAQLPGRPLMVTAAVPATAVLAPTPDGQRLWAVEYHSRTVCALRELVLAGPAVPHPPRTVPCGTRPVAETPHGLWVTQGPDAFVAATTTTGPADYTYLLLDPDTLAERARYPQAYLVDEHRIVTTDDNDRDPVLRDLRTGTAAPLAWPGDAGYPDIGPRSPDGRYLLVRFAQPSASPQQMDLWLLDMVTLGWLQVPGFPAYTVLKATALAWAPDGRLVLLGAFPRTGNRLVVWRPGTALPGVGPYPLPDEHHDAGLTSMIVW